MRKLLPLILCSFFSSFAFAQTIVPAGNVSGIWTAAGSPYLILGNLLIPNGTTLTIEPGVTVNFQGSYKMQVNGRLLAQGTAADSIHFIAANISTGWQGIRFESTLSSNDSSKISYCSVKYGFVSLINGGGIYVNNFSKISITHCSITNCTAQAGLGGAIYMGSSNGVISDNNISYNHSMSGAIQVMSGSPLISSNYISFNDNVYPPPMFDPGMDPDNNAGGISCSSGSAIITNNTITNNSSALYGGGIFCRHGSQVITNNIITHNTSASRGGGILCADAVTVSNNLIDNNSSPYGAGIYFENPSNGQAIFNHNTITNNTAVNAGAGIGILGRKITISNNFIANNALTNTIAFYLEEGGGGVWLVNSDSSVFLSNNIISNNAAPTGGAIHCFQSAPKLFSNTVTNNSAANGGGLYCVSSSPSLLNMLLWGNTASSGGAQFFLYDDLSDPSIQYSNIPGGRAAFDSNFNSYTGIYQNNIDVNPLFIAPSAGSGTGFNGVAANWGLQDGSPCINTGKPGGGYPATDQAGNIRVLNGIIDIGALENQTPIPPTATVSGGGQVCVGAALPSVVFTFTYGTLPFTLQYSINGVPQTPVTGINNLQYTIPNAAPGIYTVASITDAVTTGTGIGLATVTVVQPVADFTINDDRQCLPGNNFIFINTSTTNSGSLIYSWNFGDGAGPAFITNPAHVYAAAGTYNVQLIVSGNAGCADTIIKTVTVTSFSINTLQDTVKTYQDSVILNAGAGFVNYLWSTGNTTQNITVKSSGWYIATVTNNDGCTARDSSYVNFRKNKTLFIDKKQNLCAVSSFDLSVRTKNITNVIGLQGTISWNVNIIRLDSVVYDNSTLNITANDINLTNKANGYITYSWSDNTLTGRSVADSAGIFTLKFSKSNTGSAVTVPVVFSSSQTALEIDTINLITHIPVITTETAYISGSAGFRQGAGTSSVTLAACDSVVYNNRVYYDSAIVFDTLRHSGTQCDSLYKIVYINIYHATVPSMSISTFSNNILYGTSVTFSSSINFGGPSPLIQWYKNGSAIAGETGSSFTTSTLNAGDTVYAVLKSSLSCALADSVYSNLVRMNVSYIISGVVKNPAGAAVRNPIVNISGYSNQNITANTTGNYSGTFQGGPAHNYTIRPSKNNDVNRTNGVSTLDVAIIQSHILNSTLFNSPYQWIAADVNKSNTVTSIDILLIKRFILGLDNSFPGNRQWGFADTSNGGLNPLQPLPYKDSITITDLLANKPNQNFIGVKLGDVNFDWNSSLSRPVQPAAAPVNFYYDDVKVKTGEEIRVPVRVKNFRNVLGMQFTLNFNSETLQLQRIENNRLNIQYAMHSVNEGKLPFIWNDDHNKPGNLNDGDILLELVFTEKNSFIEEDISVTPDIAAIELWDGNYTKHNIVKSTGRILKANSNSLNYTSESWSVTPNPTTGIVTLNLQLLKEKNIGIKLLNGEGKTIMSQGNYLPKGISTIKMNLDKTGRLASGIYFMKITGIEGNSTRKIVLVK